MTELEDNLSKFADIIDGDEVLLFERATFLVSGLDMLCTVAQPGLDFWGRPELILFYGIPVVVRAC